MRNKRGIAMLGLVFIAIAVIVIIVFGSNLFNQTTGQATLTPGADYGPINQKFNIYTQCKYVTENDGWDVTKKTQVEYLDITIGMKQYSEDSCGVTRTSVVEYNCESGYRKKRIVECPQGMQCRDGACVYV